MTRGRPADASPDDDAEAARIARLEQYGILDTEAEQGFDDLVLLASRICEAPVALISLVARDRQWFKARVGFEPRQTPIAQSVCAHAIKQPGLFVITDLAADPRTADNTLVSQPPHIRFYAGCRLDSSDGAALGTLCVIDTQPRPAGLSPLQGEALQALARQAVSQIELHSAAAVQGRLLAERRRAEERQSFLLGLTDRLRAHDGPRARMQAAVDALGRHLRASRVGYALFALDGDLVTLETEYVDGVPPLAGTYPCEAFGPGNIANLRAGRTSVYPDVEADADTAGIGLAAYGIGAIVAVPQVHDGWLRSVVYVNQRESRAWAPEEVALVEEVAARIWDAVERARAEDALRTVNETLEEQVAERTRERDGIWQVSRDMLGVTDGQGAWLSVNPAWRRILGWRDEEVIGRTSEWLEHPDDRERTRAETARLAQGEPVLGFENRFRVKDGLYRTLSWTAVPFEGLFYCAGRDVSEEKALLARHAETEEALRQSQKMEAVGQLTGGIAHDFNNLLTGITGCLELLQTRVAQGRADEIGRYVAAAQGGVRRAAALTHRLLAFSRRQTLDPRPTDVNRLAAGMEEMIRRTVGPAIAVERFAADGLWTTLVDPGQLENALLNLCINARDAMPQGGRLTIETANRRLDEREAAERDLPPGMYVSLAVSDDGVGMEPAVAARAFDPFFTTKPIGQGTGLGLSMIYGFARQSGGQVRLYSDVGKGTLACIYLPRHSAQAEPAAETPPAALRTPRSGRGETVLVVDDEPTVRMVAAEVLAQMGCVAIEAADGPAGLRILESDARIDLLVTDVGLPGGIDGRQLAEAARALRPELKVLFITGFAEHAVLSRGPLDPGMHVLSKPFGIERLAERMRELIAAE